MSVLCETLSHKDSAHIILKNGPLGIGNHIGAMKLHDVGFGEEAGLSRTAAPYDKDILVSRVLRILRTVGHHQPFGLCQQHIVFKHRVDKGLDVGGRTP